MTSSSAEVGGRVVVAPTITSLPECVGAVLLTGSHGGLYPGRLAARAGVRAVVFHDAGVGLQAAGIAALTFLGSLGISAAAVLHTSARIGDADDMLERGVISHVNDPARRVGAAVGMSVRDALEFLRFAPHVPAPILQSHESRYVLASPSGRRPLVLVDSAAQVDPVQDVGAIIVTGSHGGLVGNDPGRALKAEAFAAVFNDAGGGAGTSRLAVLAERGIAALTVAAGTARIGDAASTLAGVASAANRRATALGAEIGAPVAALLLSWIELR